MKRKLGMNMGFIGGIPQTEQLKMAHEAGFESFFTGSQDQNNIAALRALADQLGMEFETIHAPFGGINNMWIAGMDYLNVYKGMRHSIDLAADNGIPAVVTHVSSGWYPPGINDLGLQRFDEIVLYAADKGVKLAFENLRCIGNLAYFADRYEKLDTVGFCYDIGHEHCYTKTLQWMDVFCHKLICTHIHDNLGRDFERVGNPDMHLLPFDGNTDYKRAVDKMDEYGYRGPLTLEVGRGERYQDLTPEAFLKTCHERLERICAMSEAPDPDNSDQE